MDFFFQSIGYKIAFADMKYKSASTFLNLDRITTLIVSRDLVVFLKSKIDMQQFLPD